jgi:pimeloyl-ACP methyl ester carboxylesterase
MSVAYVNGVRLYYEVHGQGTPILGIHGTPSSATLWVDAARELAHRGRCIIYDRRGFLRSTQSRPLAAVDLADHVEDAASLLDAVAAERAIVIGRSTGGQIALELARRFPDKVMGQVLLEPALLTVDDRSAAWAAGLRRRVVEAAEAEPSSAAEIVLREALGDQTWEAFPPELREMFEKLSPAVLAEMRGRGLDLSADPLQISREDAAQIRQPTLLVSAEDSPEVLRRVNDRLAEMLPVSQKVVVGGGHLIDPAHPVVLAFVDALLAAPRTG